MIGRTVAESIPVRNFLTLFTKIISTKYDLDSTLLYVHFTGLGSILQLWRVKSLVSLWGQAGTGLLNTRKHRFPQRSMISSVSALFSESVKKYNVQDHYIKPFWHHIKAHQNFIKILIFLLQLDTVALWAADLEWSWRTKVFDGSAWVGLHSWQKTSSSQKTEHGSYLWLETMVCSLLTMIFPQFSKFECTFNDHGFGQLDRI